MQKSKAAKRDRAIREGLEFIYNIACEDQNFTSHGSDLLTCFFLIASTSQDSSLRKMARKMGQERAHQWRQDHPSLPQKANAENIIDLVFGSYAAENLGIYDEALKKPIRHAAARFTAHNYLRFNPATEPPPSDVPERCDCGTQNPRGRKVCRKCQKHLLMTSRHWIYVDALARSYIGERYGVLLGAPFADVIKWLPRIRPYRGYENGNNTEFYETIYAVTHVVYTLNDYSVYKLSPDWLPEEFAYLKMNLAQAIEMDDPEMLGEIMDTLRSFGLTSDQPLIRNGMDYLLAKQNHDGSWGDSNAENIYQRYHSTWTAIDGLREYRWRGEGLSFPKLKPLLQQWANDRD